MLSVKPWKLEAIVRLVLSVFICAYLGTLVASALQRIPTSHNRTLFYCFALSSVTCLGVALYLVHARWKTERLTLQAAILLALFYGGLMLGVLAQKHASRVEPSTAQMLIGTLSIHGASLVIVSRMLRYHETDWKGAFGLAHRWRFALLAGLGMALLFLPLGKGLQWLSVQAMEHLPFHPLRPHEQDAVEALRTAFSWPQRIMLGLVTILLVPVAEEVFFRGILYPYLKFKGMPRAAVLVTSFLFALVHANLMIFLPLFVFAALLILLYDRTGNLLAPVAAHATFNAVNFVLLYWTQAQESSAHIRL